MYVAPEFEIAKVEDIIATSGGITGGAANGNVGGDGGLD